MEMNGSSHLASTETKEKVKIIANSLVDRFISRNPDLENDIADESSFNINSNFSLKEATNHVKTEEISNSEMDTIVQNIPSPLSWKRNKRFDNLSKKTTDKQKKDTSLRTSESSNKPNTIGPWNVTFDCKLSTSECAQSVRHVTDLNLEQKDQVCWKCFRKSVFCLDARLCSSAVDESKTRKSNEAKISNRLDGHDTKEKSEKQTVRMSRRNLHKVVCKDSDAMTQLFQLYGQNHGSTVLLKNGNKITNALDTHQVALLQCWMCSQNFYHCLEVKTHILREHHETLYALIEKFCVRPPLLFCPKDCEYIASNKEDLTGHIATCQRQELQGRVKDTLNTYNLLSQEYIELKQNISPRASFEQINRQRSSPPDRQKIHSQQDISLTGEEDDDDVLEINNDSSEIFTRNNRSNVKDLAPSSYQSGITGGKNNHCRVKDLASSCHQSQSGKTRGKNINGLEEPLKDLQSDELDNSAFSSSALLKTHTPRMYKCQECEEIFSQVSYLHNHMKIHEDLNSKLNRFKCSRCSMTFMLKSQLCTHYMKTHRSKKSFTHKQCGRLYQRDSLNRRHMEIYTHEKPFKCKECGQTFRLKYHLNRHIRRHMKIKTGDKPFKCKECGLTYRENFNLKRHMRIHKKPIQSFKCKECGLTYRGKHNLKRHMRIHTGVALLKCKECGRNFTNKPALNRHMSSHNYERPFGCEECGRTFKAKTHLNEHVKRHSHEKPFKCKECGHNFVTKYECDMHLKRHYGEKPFKCKECGHNFSTKGEVNKHMKIMHIGEKSFKFKCTECGQNFSTKRGLNIHMRIHSNKTSFKCWDCGQIFSEKCALNKHKIVHIGERPFKCKECSQTFRAESVLKRHMRIHTGEKPFSCNECGQAFRTKSCLTRHMTRHTGEKPFKCMECGRSFATRGSLLTHLNVHTDERPSFECKECSKIFRVKYILMEHMRIHTGEKPFSCNECGQAFRTKSSLTKHMRRHTGEKPFKCKECDRSFAASCNLLTHLKVHTDERPSFKCKECDQTYRSRDKLQSHMRRHTGGKPFECKDCDRTYMWKDALRAHMKTHLREKPFKCEECGQSYSVKSKLKRHVRIHSGEKLFDCKECGQAFGDKKGLNRHMRVHTGEKPFKCKDCGRTFTWQNNLKTHMKRYCGVGHFLKLGNVVRVRPIEKKVISSDIT